MRNKDYALKLKKLQEFDCSGERKNNYTLITKAIEWRAFWRKSIPEARHVIQQIGTISFFELGLKILKESLKKPCILFL